MKKIPFNETFFNLYTEKSFYWAGYLAADGCLRERIVTFKSGSKTQVYETQLDSIDKEMMVAFCQDLECLGRKLVERRYQTRRGAVTIYKIAFKSKTMFDSLGKFGIIPKKSLVLQMPQWVEEHPLVNHFIRGYFDGDGSVFFQRNSKFTEFRGTVPFLTSINKIIKSNIEKETRADVHIHSGCGSLKYTGNNLTIQVADFMYKNATIFLKRKYDKFYA